ncbi:unnamed protein product [Trichogramma brassicae]|uniref:Uncharacterized protein n=1 Tax=Trichogramma brassicae TaxID=86971 RepID=A0A6H5HXM2_9HYME|nr:unnamed protein product [Trichogramma brassicae]
MVERSLFLTIFNFEKLRSHVQLVTGIIANCLKLGRLGYLPIKPSSRIYILSRRCHLRGIIISVYYKEKQKKKKKKKQNNTLKSLKWLTSFLFERVKIGDIRAHGFVKNGWQSRKLREWKRRPRLRRPRGYIARDICQKHCSRRLAKSSFSADHSTPARVKARSHGPCSRLSCSLRALFQRYEFLPSSRVKILHVVASLGRTVGRSLSFD